MTRDLLCFAGAWDITRTIDDRKAGGLATFEGLATLAPEGEGLRYHEAGHLHVAGQVPFAAERRYLWRSVAGQIHVFFQDGRFFHAFDPDALNSDAAHWCDPDQYDVRYDFSDWPVWTTLWQVSGPRKDYGMESRYTRRPSR